ncbi:amino acid/amide ABC transporter substrate-binding protein (HAAT family) [Anseongella ginsenosidimutans]|uniref:Amino acid/amide ABC transporter substrate-binding protein (HAAT family) n=1 Tax=Anseongella ginsenosidimutans TaxID=496056 RepID=A0A4V2UTA7_9SPHI|nr:ABC transporter substrate-binding protein [Anseongella ginsenosidimutans]QEC51900.1 ABC transporter substrate-binding protein [Anseongella ginsenosidimutans]TCS85077.1 amino acid/amide ABC transporter substrate-binding protein (HAAT family) [Anseongella ginsenosidimutans]
MKRPFRIGFLTPYSGIYPFYPQHLTAGWLLGMGLDPFRQDRVQFVHEYTKTGSGRDSVQAVRKLVFFDRVDLVSGLVGYKAITEAIPVLEQAGQTAFFFDMGEYIPYFPYLSPNIFYASHQLWQSEYALGHWAQQYFGDAGLVLMPVYEAGYHFSAAFRRGAIAAGNTALHLQVLPDDPGQSMQIRLKNFFASLEEKEPPYVHAIFCGNHGTAFLAEWAKSKWAKRIPLLVNEPMAYDDILQDVANLDLEIYSSTMWDNQGQHGLNREFVDSFEAACGQKANVFALMGYEAGLVWKELWPSVEKADWDGIRNLLRQEIIVGPRGERNFYPQSGFALPQTTIYKIRTSRQQPQKMALAQGKGMHFNAAAFEEIHRDSVSGWQNPFMCV